MKQVETVLIIPGISFPGLAWLRSGGLAAAVNLLPAPFASGSRVVVDTRLDQARSRAGQSQPGETNKGEIMTNDPHHVKFNLGQTVITRNALDTLNQTDITAAILRHVSGDWGDVCKEDRQSNNRALKEGSRLLSVYQDARQTVFWIITEWDRSVTTVLLPEDY